MAQRKDRKGGLKRHFEGSQLLDELLAMAHSPYTTVDVIAFIQDAIKTEDSPSDLFPTFFESEPKFSNPEYAHRLFGNLFGLWDALEAGTSPEKLLKAGKPKEKKPKPVPPEPFGSAEPDVEFVEAAWRYLEDDSRARERLFHSFENKQDALLQRLDEEQLSDEGYAIARHLLFELSAMIELGSAKGLGSANPDLLSKDPAPASIPGALADYADEALFEAEQDEELPLSGKEAQSVRSLATRGLFALWSARKDA
jgi:hypothetical protein